MSDMIGLLRFGMPISPAPAAPLVEVHAQKAAPEIAAVSASSGGGQAAANYTATPRPAISPQFAYASAGEGATGGGAAGGGASSVIALPEPFDPNVLTGPPPTFEATLLELEAHLRMSLARIDASRNVHAMDRQAAPERPKSDLVPPEASAATGHQAAPAVAGTAKPAPQPVLHRGQTPATGAVRQSDGSYPVADGGAAKSQADAAPKAAAEPAPA